ncbi:DUF4240 domain-containing protein [Gimesia aquarii]|uniref:DUF4240 domain-containing protein n=1 Tax=Gimesia aquarii TaxID=2527964 RepID=A0A517W2S7_9PLAN|nr:DUF4240 domain-containing protein [Gimesia aquarii]QDT99571.1 hypothetical protein V144x_50830 [Gimesia aquarii]
MSNLNFRGSFRPEDISQWFWSIIDLANSSRDRLETRLREMSKDELIRFHNEFDEAATQLVDEPFSKYLPIDTSEDHLRDIAEWIVSQGQSYFTEVWNNPQKISEVTDVTEGVTYSSISDNVYWDRFNDIVPDAGF